MSFRPIGKDELDEWEKHPAKQYIHEPLGGIIEESMNPEDLAWLLAWRERVAAWVESAEADTQARVAKEAGEVYAREVENLKEMAKRACYPKEPYPSTARKQAELAASRGEKK